MNFRLLLCLAPLVVSATAAAQTAAPAGDTPLQPLFECRAISDDAQRLACLDAAVDALRAQSETGEVVAVERGEIEAAEEAVFGLSVPNLSLPSLPRLSLSGSESSSATLAEAEALTAETTEAGARVVTRNEDGRITQIDRMQIAEIEEGRYGALTFTLTNGQVWRQTDGTRVQISRRTPVEQLGLSVQTAALGSFFLRVEDARIDRESRWFRGERLR